MRLPDTAVSGVIFAILAVMVATAAGYPPAARLVPLVVGIPAVLLAGYQLLRDTTTPRPLAGERADADGGPHASGDAAAVLWLVIFVFLVLAGGFVVGGALAIVVSQRFWLRESWRTALTGGAISVFVVYFCLDRQLGIPLFDGWLAAWVRG